MTVKAGLLAAVRGFTVAVLSMAVSLAHYILVTVSIALIPIGIGVLTTPVLMQSARAQLNMRRRISDEWFGVEVAVPYRKEPRFQGGVIGQAQRCQWMLRDPATWRDLLWMFIDPSVGFTLGILPLALIGEGVYGFVLAAGVWKPVYDAGGGEWYGFIHVTSQTSAFMAAGLGIVFLATGLRFGPAITRGQALVARALLGPNHERELELRVERLTETRSDALDTSAAELRRIERDLHDGAQARLVAMGMSLGAVERLMERDPERAKLLLAQARESSAMALHELRDLVRGIHPPVLAERGLGDAVRALALRIPIRTEVTVELSGRADAPVEAAAYFAVSETLANAAKHSGAEQIWIDIRHEGGMLRIAVVDDGQGGADLERGTGLRGVERRLGTFDGVLALSSPPGGPTMVTMELPCVLSSPKTSSS
ncbi:sensor histidine kinase [Wenjunlia tyrosinilytica]|uniref:histidine kinase n=1 Tax=Wenjunlia tyrosinilytica TaxID=1544741 RepID=A0A917ZNI6_9ACTN|nr:sensor domain-containing protein [Wenjunlia tyrosinilytica]GGO87089.1 histidine kinase [Wenjunlia tyrosinilytica]